MTDEDKAGDAAAFLRQRRNLILGSIALIFVEVAELRLKPDLALLGVGFHIEHPEAMVWLLWIAVFYWALRYYQFQHTKPPKVRRIAQQRMEYRITSFFQRNAQALLPDQYANKPSVPEGATAHFFAMQPEHLKWGVFSGTAELGSNWVVRMGDKNIDQQTQTAALVQISAWPLWRIRIREYGYVVFRTPEFTEHWLPYALFALALLVKAYHLVTIRLGLQVG